MTIEANWSYTAKFTIWRVTGKSGPYNNPTYAPPEVYLCDYQGGISAALGDIGLDISRANTIWTEYANAKVGDYVLIGESSELNPLEAGADLVQFITRYADTFHRVAEDFAIVTGSK